MDPNYRQICLYCGATREFNAAAQQWGQWVPKPTRPTHPNPDKDTAEFGTCDACSRSRVGPRRRP